MMPLATNITTRHRLRGAQWLRTIRTGQQFFRVLCGLSRVMPGSGETPLPRAQVSTHTSIDARNGADYSRGGGRAKHTA